MDCKEEEPTYMPIQRGLFRGGLGGGMKFGEWGGWGGGGGDGGGGGGGRFSWEIFFCR